MTRRLIACLMITALLSAGCKKKHADPAAAGSGSTAAAASGEVTPSAATLAAGALATSSQTADGDAARALAAMPVADKVALAGKLIDATIAYEASVARDRSWDPATVIAKVGTARAKLFAWVHDQTALVPYTGMLRGAVGVMMDRVGNNLDRSLLLADLLTKAGGETRLAHATLDPANAGKLAAAWPKAARPAFPRTPEDPTVVANAITALGGDRAALEKRLAAQTAARAEIATKVRAQIDVQAGALAKMIETAPVAAPGDASVLADHWWVQVKDGEAWTDLDLAVDAPGTSLVPAAETMAVTEIPETLQHVVAVRVIGEVWHDTAREETTLVEHAFAPAQFYGQRLSVTTVPIDLPDDAKLSAGKDRPAAVRAAIVAQTEWLPMIQMGVTPVVHFTVTDGGELYDATDANGNSNRLARLVQKATKTGVGGATGLLEGMPDGTGSDQPVPPKLAVGPHAGFTAEWLEIEVRTPNAPPRVVRRTIFDALGAPADRGTLKPIKLDDGAKLDRGLALMGDTEVLAQFARIPPGYVADRVAKYLTAAKPTMLALAQSGGKDPSEELKAAVTQALPPPTELDELAVQRFAWNASDRAFVDQLDVLTARRVLVSKKGILRTHNGFDILTNGVGAWGSPAEARKARIAQGVADTLAESVLRPCVAGNGVCIRGPNTSDAFVGATSWTLTSAATSSSIAGLPADAKRIASADLANGYAIVAAPNGHPATWWRVRTTTGETLGQGATGGAEYAEYTFRFRAMTLTLGWLGCIAGNDTGGRVFACMVGVGIGAISGGNLVSSMLAAVSALIGFLVVVVHDPP